MKKTLVCSFLLAFVSLIVLAHAGYGDVKAVKDLKNIKAIKLQKFPVYDLNKIPPYQKGSFYDLSKIPVYQKIIELPEGHRAPIIKHAMTYDESQKIAAKFDEMRTKLETAILFWTTCFTRAYILEPAPTVAFDANGNMENVIGEISAEEYGYAVKIDYYKGKPGLFFSKRNLLFDISQTGYYDFYNLIKNLKEAQDKGKDIIYLLSKFDYLPNQSPNETDLPGFIHFVWFDEVDKIFNKVTLFNWLQSEIGPKTFGKKVFIYGITTDPKDDLTTLAAIAGIHYKYFYNYFDTHSKSQ